MHVALDVHYGAERLRGACLGFQHPWDDRPAFVVVEVLDRAAEPYEPGYFWRRELPCLMQLVEAARERCPDLATVLVDGYVCLGGDRHGLGQHLFEALGGSVPVIGVAKSRFKGAPAIEVLRGTSANPLFVTAAGVEASAAAVLVRSMHGAHRIPTLLKWVDRVSRGFPD